MTAYDTYQGLDSGLIDCTMFYSYAIPAFKLNEVADNITMLDWGALMALGIVMNKDAYEAMMPEHQKVIDDLGSELIDVYAQKITAANAQALADMKTEAKSFSLISLRNKKQNCWPQPALIWPIGRAKWPLSGWMATRSQRTTWEC